jgi:versiconal hemiacetal acetate esterase
VHPRLRDLPKTYIAAAGRDTLRDDARLMRVALNRAEYVFIMIRTTIERNAEHHRVPNKFHEFEGYPHWFWTFPSRHLAGAIKEYNQKLLEGFNFIMTKD